jgi:hypothetical protein
VTLFPVLCRFDSAIDAYLQAVDTYRSAAGERHPQFATTLANLGLCFQVACRRGSGGREAKVLE